MKTIEAIYIDELAKLHDIQEKKIHVMELFLSTKQTCWLGVFRKLVEKENKQDLLVYVIKQHLL